MATPPFFFVSFVVDFEAVPIGVSTSQMLGSPPCGLML